MKAQNFRRPSTSNARVKPSVSLVCTVAKRLKVQAVKRIIVYVGFITTDSIKLETIRGNPSKYSKKLIIYPPEKWPVALQSCVA